MSKNFKKNKLFLWKEPTNPAELLEKEDMVLDPEWKKKVVEKLLQEEEPKVEKEYLLKLNSIND